MSQNSGEVAPVAQEKINTDIVTLTRFLTEEQRKHKEATGDFTYACNSISTSIRPDTMLTLLTKPTMPRSAVFLQIHCLLHSPSQSHQSQRSCRFIKQHRGRPKETGCHWQ